MPIIVAFNGEQQWLDLRAQDITSTESPALFGLSPYCTEFELYHLKAAGGKNEFSDNERMIWGRRLEKVIAEGAAEDLGLLVKPLKNYMRHSDEPRMGSSFDFRVDDITINGASNAYRDAYKEFGPGLMEVKNVDGLVYRGAWDDDEAPEHIEVQVQHQMEVADVEWCVIVALVGGNTVKHIFRRRDREMGTAIRQAVRRFWKRVETGAEPKPDFERDAEFIAKLYGHAGEGVIDASDDPKMSGLLLEYQNFQQQEADAKKRKEAIKAEILTLIGENATVLGPDGLKVNAGMVKEVPPTVIEEWMVGQTYGGRKPYRMFRVTQSKKKDQ